MVWRTSCEIGHGHILLNIWNNRPILVKSTKKPKRRMRMMLGQLKDLVVEENGEVAGYNGCTVHLHEFWMLLITL